MYSFDIRKLNTKQQVMNIHEGHTSAVLDVDYSPTGQEFCTASYDKSIRIFRTAEVRHYSTYG